MSELSAAVRERPSPAPVASMERPIDLVHLARMTLGERSLEREVLQLFDRQAAILVERMQAAPVDAIASLAHTLKGSARAVGAFAVADAASRLEAAIARGFDPSAALAELGEAVAEARAAIEAVLRRS
jgi:HPt (histidine-containing phosphotransfer) domain-containing protein